MSPPEPAVVAVDVGGTKIRAGRVRRDDVTDVTTRPSPSAAGGGAMVDAIAGAAAAVLARGPAAGLAVATAGTVDAEAGTILAATASIAGWSGTPLRALLAERLALPVVVDNDATAFVVGEAAAGAGLGYRRVLGITLGTGIGIGVAVDGERCEPDGFAATREALQHAEVEAGGRGIEAAYLSRTGDAVDLAEIVRRDDETGRALMARATDVLRDRLAAAVRALGVDVLVVGGGIALRVEGVIERLAEGSTVPVLRARLGDDAALIGAAHIWRTQERRA